MEKPFGKLEIRAGVAPCPDRPEVLRRSALSRPVAWRIALFDKLTRRPIAKMLTASEAQIIAMQRRPASNFLTRIIFGGLAPGVARRDERIATATHSLEIRLYEPPQRARPRQAMLYMHGGGWIIGEIGMMDWLCSRIAAQNGMLVASLGYRLAPGTRFPGAVEDCQAALGWLHGKAAELGIDPARISVGGESAGGNLAAALCLAARHGPAIDRQVLIYPALDLTGGSASIVENAEAPILSMASGEAFCRHYLGADGDAGNPLASPLYAPDLGGLPPTLILVAEHDPLRDDGWRYAARLEAAGVRTRITEYAGAAHGFVNFPGLCGKESKRALDEISVFLARTRP